MHTQFDAAVVVPGDAQVLDPVTQFAGIAHVFRQDAGDALDVDRIEAQRHAEGERGQDHQLVGGINALHVEGRIGLGVTQQLCLDQDIGEVAALVAHLAENEIAGAVDDAGQPADPVCGKAFAQRLDDGNAAGHRGLVGQGDAACAGDGEQLVPTAGDQRLVGGDHLFTVGDGGEYQLAGGLDAADQLHQHVDRGIAGNFEDVVGEGDRAEIGLGPRAAGTDLHDLDLAATALGQHAGVAPQHLERAAADGAKAAETDSHRRHDQTPQKGGTLERPPWAVNAPQHQGRCPGFWRILPGCDIPEPGCHRPAL